MVAHETGHTLTLEHTHQTSPASDTQPGCWSDSAPPSDWPFLNNYIQSSAGPEVGFDVATKTAINPLTDFDLMGYCAPGWISPFQYKKMIQALGGGTVASPSSKSEAARPQATTPSATPQPFWIVSGTVDSSGLTLDPIFQAQIIGDTSTGSGTYSIVVEDASGNALFTRLFTPAAAVTDNIDNSIGAQVAQFSETIPFTQNAAAIIVLDPSSNRLANVKLAGQAPTVTVVSPSGGTVESGKQNVSWSVKGPADYSSRIFYSADNGSTWVLIAGVQNQPQYNVNFDLLPGSTQAEIQVLVSDGVNTGSATSAAFIVPKKKPSIISIDSPISGFSQPAANPVYLSGSVYDVDDGVLSGSGLQWSDNVSGNLGTGSPLTVTLKAGAHVITLTGTDSDGNTITATTNVLLGGQPPVVSLTGQALNTAPTTCEFATVAATPGATGGRRSR